MGFLGGDVALIHDGAARLRRQATALTERQAGVTQARSQGARGCGGSVVATALSRLEAAYGDYLDAVQAEVSALGTLAEATGDDIAAATTGGQVQHLPGAVFR